MTSRRFWIVLLLSMGLVGLELLWTRIFAAEFFYTFAFLILSLAVLGLGVGALLNRLSERLRDRWRPEALLFLAAFAALVGPPLILRLGLEFGILFRSPKQVLLLLLALLILSLPYVAGGAALARIFRERSAEMPRLYMADLSGAGMGVGLAVLLMNGIGVPAGAVLVTVPLALSAWFAAGRFRLVYVALWGLIAVTGVFSGPLLQIPRRELGPVIHERWDALGRVKVQRMSPEYWNLNIDNVANSPVLRFDGDYKGERAKQARFLFEVKTLMEGRGRFTVASLGAGGGTEVYQALLAGAAEVHAVEVNPAINDMLVNGFLSEFTGRIYSDPRVRVVSEDGRAYLRRFRDHFDVIISSSSNTFAAMASGSFALCEDYLFTTEAFADYYRALAPGGLLLMEHQFYIPRAASEALDALTDLGVEDPMSHLAVYELPQRRRKILVMRKGALDGEILNRIVEPLTPENFDQLRLLYPPQEGTGGNLVERILTEGWESQMADSPVNLRPCSDDRPFVAQMGLWKNLSWIRKDKVLPYEFFGFPMSRVILLIILGVALGFALPLMALPYLRPGPRLRAAPWLYFFAIGLGFMAVEVALIQQFSLLVGASARTVALILFCLLVGSGIGSRFSRNVPTWLPFAGILCWIVLHAAFFDTVVASAGTWGPVGRTALAAAVLLPLGFFMGMPFPLASLRVGELVDWGFAVNGVGSVLGSTAVLLLAMEAGFSLALLAAGGCYLLAGLLLSWRGAWRTLGIGNLES